MKLGRIHKHGTRRSKSTGDALLVVEFVIEEIAMLPNGTNDQVASTLITYLVTERAKLLAANADLTTKLANSIPTDADTNTAIAGLDTVIKAVPADVLAAATAPVAAPASPPADGTAPAAQPVA